MIELICGYLGRESAPVDFDLVNKMVASLCFGRSYSKKIWSDGQIALARVAVAAEASDPAETALRQRGPTTVAADLRLPGQPNDEAAHEVVFRAISARELPDALDGEFAIAAWDSHRKELTLARDRLGIRPLFFTRPSAGEIAFASFPDALIDSGLVEGRFRPEAMARRVLPEIRGGEPCARETWIEGIFRLLPGHVMVVGPNKERLRRYWRYPVDRPESTDDPAAAARGLRTELETAVARALPDHGAPFTHLSGGLDSSAVAALAARLTDAPPSEVTAYCITVPDAHRGLGAIDEEATARAAARHLGVTLVPHALNTVRDGLLSPLDRLFINGAGYSTEARLSHAASHGATSLLCGFGGDEVVSYGGEGVLLSDFLGLRWDALQRTSRGLSRPAWRVLGSEAAAAFLPAALESRLRHYLGLKILEPPLHERVLQPAFRPSRSWRWPTIGPIRVQRERLEKDLFVYRLELQAWEAAQHGMRYVFPLLDWRLLEFASTLPPRLQLRNGMRRALFRAAVSDLLPSTTIEQPTKLIPTPSMIYQLAADKEALIEEARRVSQSPAASAVIDLAEIERRLLSLPEPEVVVQAIRRMAATGAQLKDPHFSLYKPFEIARALAQNEAAIGGHDRSRSRAA